VGEPVVTIGGSREIMEEMIWQEVSVEGKTQREVAFEYRVSRDTIGRIMQKKRKEYGEE